MQTEKIQARIESYTSNLTQAIQGGSGAQFSLLLSMISANQELFQPAPASASGTGFALPVEVPEYPDPNTLYTPQVTERFNHSVNDHLRGDFAYLNAYVDTGSRTPRNLSRALDSFEKVSLMAAGKMMLSEINSSRATLATA